MATGALPSTEAATTVPRGQSPGRRLWRATWRESEFRIGLVLFLALIAAALIYPHLTELSATKIAVKDKFLPPAFLAGGSWDHILGTDQLGRDLFLRSLLGLQNALLI